MAATKALELWVFNGLRMWASSAAGGTFGDAAWESATAAARMLTDRGSPTFRNGLVSMCRHTASARAEAHGVGARLNASSRAIKDADPALLFSQNLLGCQTLDDTHLAAAAWAALSSDVDSGGTAASRVRQSGSISRRRRLASQPK